MFPHYQFVIHNNTLFQYFVLVLTYNYYSHIKQEYWFYKWLDTEFNQTIIAANDDLHIYVNVSLLPMN